MAESDAGSKRKWDDLRAQRDELKTAVQTQDKLISALGLDDDDKVKRIKRILGIGSVPYVNTVCSRTVWRAVTPRYQNYFWTLR